MRKKRMFIISAATLILLTMLFPSENRLRDGGTAVYEPVTRIYKIERLHRGTEQGDGFITGTAVYIFGNEVYNDSKLERDQ